MAGENPWKGARLNPGQLISMSKASASKCATRVKVEIQLTSSPSVAAAHGKYLRSRVLV